VVAALRGRPGANPDEGLADLPAFVVSDEIVRLAIKAVDQVLESSDLKACWEETDDFNTWVATVMDIRQRLAQL